MVFIWLLTSFSMCLLAKPGWLFYFVLNVWVWNLALLLIGIYLLERYSTDEMASVWLLALWVSFLIKYSICGMIVLVWGTIAYYIFFAIFFRDGFLTQLNTASRRLTFCGYENFRFWTPLNSFADSRTRGMSGLWITHVNFLKIYFETELFWVTLHFVQY